MAGNRTQIADEARPDLLCTRPRSPGKAVAPPAGRAARPGSLPLRCDIHGALVTTGGRGRGKASKRLGPESHPEWQATQGGAAGSWQGRWRMNRRVRQRRDAPSLTSEQLPACSGPDRGGTPRAAPRRGRGAPWPPASLAAGHRRRGLPPVAGPAASSLAPPSTPRHRHVIGGHGRLPSRWVLSGGPKSTLRRQRTRY